MSWCKLASQGNLGRITDATYFVSNDKVEEMLTGIIITMQVPQAPSAFKFQTKIVLDVGGFHLAPSMTIVVVVHALHLFRMASWKMNG
jgi:hypothetical protein